MKNKINYKLINILVTIVIAYFLYLLRNFIGETYSLIMNILKPFIIGFVLAYAFYPFIKMLQKKRIPKVLSVLILISILLVIILFIIFSIIPIFTKQLTMFFTNIMKFLTNINDNFDINLSSLKRSVLSYYSEFLNNAGKYISDGALTIFNASINFLSNFIISLVSFLYFIFNMDTIRYNVKILMKKRGKKFNRLLRETDSEISNYFKGLLLCILIQFIEYTTLFYLIGHPNFLLLGVICSISTVIPYFGGIIANVIAVITASVVSTKLLIMTLIIAFICPNIDGYIISPRIYGKTNQLSPIISIFAVFAGGVIGGFIGILISLPIAIIIKVIFKNYKKEIIEKMEELKK